MKAQSFRWRTRDKQEIPNGLPVLVAIRDSDGAVWFQAACEDSGYLFVIGQSAETLDWDHVVAWAHIPPLPPSPQASQVVIA